MLKRVPILIFALTLGLAFVSSPGRIVGQTGTILHAAQTASGQQTGQGMAGMQMNMQDMNKMHEKMMADMKAEQAKLDDLVKKMNSATGDAKTKIMADLLTEIVRDHQAMADHMDMMHQHMMKMGK